VLSATERNAILIEMRGFLESVQGIVAGLAEQNTRAIATSARTSGMASAQGVPQALKDKLPTEFKKLGMATHMAFDGLARESMEIGDRQVILKQLGALMGNCTTCHAGYRIDEEGWRRK
jgi:cytochrome c556